MLNNVVKAKFKCHLFLALAAVFLRSLADAAPVIAITPVPAAGGTTIQVPITLLADTNILSAQFDLRFNSKILTVGEPDAGNALADHMIASSPIAPGTLRVALTSCTHRQLKNGVLIFVPFTVATNAPTQTTLLLTNVTLLDPATNQLHPVTLLNTTLIIAPQPLFTVTPATNTITQTKLHATWPQ